MTEGDPRDTPAWAPPDRAAAELWAAAERAATATGLGLALATTVGADIQIIAINDLGLRILGRSRAETLAHPTMPFIAPEDTPRMRVQHDAMLRGEAAPTRFETTIARADGTRLPVAVAFGQLVLDGRSHFIVVIADISERKAVEARLAKTDRLAALGTLAAGVAHEINNPLAFVAVSTSVLRREIETLVPDAVARTRLFGIVAEMELGLERASTIVRDLKTFARFDDDEIGAVDLVTILGTAERLVASELRPRAKIVHEISPVPSVRGATGRLEQVLVNLLVNAAHSLPEGRPENEVRVRLAPRGEGWVELDVIDNGEGIASEDLPHVFDPFFTTKPAGQGTGLGLPVCQAIVTRLGGEIDLESTPGAGTCARVRLRTA